ncbi:MAG TPA: hypothetical protein ENI86_03055 [Acidimicrobiales bacterium]|nr:hypothetical protein [Acidimicrobiales bacterium]
MAVTSLARFRTLPGRAAAHLAATDEAVGHLRRIGLQAAALQPLAGGDVGSITTTITHADNADWAASLQRVMADEGWQEFWARVGADQPAEQVESSLFFDVDAGYQPDPDRPLGVVSATQWRAHPGRMAAFVGQVQIGAAHFIRMGGIPRVMQSVVGQHPMTVLIAVGHADLDAYGEFADTQASDEEFQAFWMEGSSNPNADLVRSGIYLNIS